VILNIMGNIISGQIRGETAKSLSEKFGRILQDRESISINSSDTSVSHSKQLELAVPASVIAGKRRICRFVTDNPDEVIELKTFHSKIIADHKAFEKERATYLPIPQIAKVDNNIVQRNYQQIKQEVQDIVEIELECILNDPARGHLVVKE